MECTPLMDTRLIRLQDDETAEWRFGAGQGHGPVAAVPVQDANGPLVVLVPGEDVLLADVTLPSRRAGDIERALPYALEEWLVDPPEDQHFAWTHEGDVVHAAVVSQQRMRQWTDILQAAGLAADGMMPDQLGLPWREGEWSLCLWQGRALLRTGKASGLACSRDVIPTLLAVLHEDTPDHRRPKRLRAWCEGDGLPFDTPFPTQVEPLPNALVDLLQVDDAPLNLLRGPYAPRRRWGRGAGRAWRWAAGMAAAWLVTLFALQAVHYLMLAHQRSQLQARIEQVFHRALPNEHRIVDARVQMQQALDKQNNGDAGGNDVLDMLADAAEPLAHASGMQVQRVVYRGGQLDVSLSAPQASAFGTLADALKSKGLQAHVRDMDASGTTATGHVEIGRPAQ
jgi:general secretion pathway protein L